MNGSHDVQALRELAIEVGGQAATADRLVDVLLSSGTAVDCDDAEKQVPESVDERRMPDRLSLGLQRGDPDGGQSAFDARNNLRVDVYGAGRTGAHIARLLATAGIGDVVIHDPAPVRFSDLCPGGFGVSAIGQLRERVLTTMIQADAVTTGDSIQTGSQLAILTPTIGSGRDEAAELLRLGIPHLLAAIVEVTGVVGPLVVPGQSSCLRCHDLHRTDRDRHWPIVLDQTVRRPPPAQACDAALSAAVAGLAATQALAFLDGFTAAAVDGTIELSLPYGLPRRRSWTRHPGCGCGWDRTDE
jgi:hypothetical protein